MAGSDPNVDANVRLQQDRFEFDKLNAQNDFALRQRELDLRERALTLKASEARLDKWLSPLTLGIAAALLAGFSSIGVTYLQNKGVAANSRSKAQSDLILESTKTTDPATGKKNLLFFIKANLIDDPNGKMTELINQDLYPSLPPAQIAQNAWVPQDGKTPDYAVALKNFGLAAAQGDPRSMANIGWIYENAFGLPKRDCNQAMEWYQKAVNAGDSIALWNIGRLYDLGCDDIKRSIPDARRFYQQAASRGVADAVRDLKKLEDAGP
jgi:hypothetical protein